MRPTGAVATCDLRPYACAVIKAGIEYIVEQRLLERSSELGFYLYEELIRLRHMYPRVFTDVRGKGYLQGLELTEAASAAIPKLRRILLEAGVFVEFMAGAGRRSGGLRYVMPTLRITPSLIAGKQDLDHMICCLTDGARAFSEEI